MTPEREAEYLSEVIAALTAAGITLVERRDSTTEPATTSLRIQSQVGLVDLDWNRVDGWLVHPLASPRRPFNLADDVFAPVDRIITAVKALHLPQVTQ